jgi:hypothetical protein
VARPSILSYIVEHPPSSSNDVLVVEHGVAEEEPVVEGVPPVAEEVSPVPKPTSPPLYAEEAIVCWVLA